MKFTLEFYKTFFLKKLFIYLLFVFWLSWVFVDVRAFSSVAASGGSSPGAVHRLLVEASLGAEPGSRVSRVHRFQHPVLGPSRRGSQPLGHRLNSCGSGLLGAWDLLGPGTEPVSPTVAGRFFFFFFLNCFGKQILYN